MPIFPDHALSESRIAFGENSLRAQREEYAGAAGWITGPAHIVERLAAVTGGIAPMAPDYRWLAAGAALIAGLALVHVWRVRRLATA